MPWFEGITVFVTVATLVATIRWAKPSADFAREEMQRRSAEDAFAELEFRRGLRDFGEILHRVRSEAPHLHAPMETPSFTVGALWWEEMELRARAAHRVSEFLAIRAAFRGAGAPPAYGATVETRLAYADVLRQAEDLTRVIIDLPGGAPYPSADDLVLKFLEDHDLA